VSGETLMLKIIPQSIWITAFPGNLAREQTFREAI
jgi:hypothetical protein